MTYFCTFSTAFESQESMVRLPKKRFEMSVPALCPDPPIGGLSCSNEMLPDIVATLVDDNKLYKYNRTYNLYIATGTSGFTICAIC